VPVLLAVFLHVSLLLLLLLLFLLRSFVIR